MPAIVQFLGEEESGNSEVPNPAEPEMNIDY
jgi:hypothetical protein